MTDIHALQAVDLLHLADEVVLHGNGPLDGQDILRLSLIHI